MPVKGTKLTLTFSNTADQIASIELTLDCVRPTSPPPKKKIGTGVCVNLSQLENVLLWRFLLLVRSRGSAVGIVIRLRAARFGVGILVGVKGVSLLQNVHIDSGAHPSSYSMGAWVLSRRWSGRSVQLTAHLCLMPRLRMSGTLWLPWLRFFRSSSSVVRQMPGYNSKRRGTVRTLPN